MLRFHLTQQPPTESEQRLFDEYLLQKGLDANIWKVFETMMKTSTRYSQPYWLRAADEKGLCGLALVVKCRRYGRTLFNNSLLAGLTNLLKIPFMLWVKFGCGMDMISNPGFVRDIRDEKAVLGAMIQYLGKNYLLTIINDYVASADLYSEAAVLPALPHALIDVSEMQHLDDYLGGHKNIRKKMRKMTNQGGTIHQCKNPLDKDDLTALKSIFVSTAAHSIMYLPYQDLYLTSELSVSNTSIKNVLYFMVHLDGRLLGYQAAIRTGTCLNTLHGAFDRQRATNFHAYDLLMVRMVEYAINAGLKSIDFGALINTTKQRMMNKTLELSYFIMSKYKPVQLIFCRFLSFTNVQSKDQLKFRT